MITANIASHLPERAKHAPEQYAVVEQMLNDDKNKYQHSLNYAQLNQQSDQVAHGLMQQGIGKGTRTVLMVKPGLDFFVLVFALFKVEAILVAVDPGIGMKNLGKCLEEAEPDAFIGIPSAQLARLILGWGRQTIKRTILVGGSFLLRPFFTTLEQTKQNHIHDAFQRDTQPEDDAAILFTSGSTGIPKGVMYTHANFTAQVNALKSLYNIQAGEVDLATFPLFALFAPALGMTSIIPKMDFTRPGYVDPETIIAAIKDYRCTNMFGSPALLNRVGKYAKNTSLHFETLKRVLSAGAPVSDLILNNFQCLLNETTQIYTPYGATESLPVSSIGSHEVLTETAEMTATGKGVCVGKPVEGINVEIINITDDVIKQWSSIEKLGANQIGEICVKGSQVTHAYYNRHSATELAKIYDEDGFYHRMGDTGYLDEQGRLWFCGRKSQRVEVDGVTLHTACCEGIFNAHPDVFRSALIGVTQADKTRPIICVELEVDQQQPDKNQLTKQLLELAKQHDITGLIETVLFHPSFPVDIRHNAKIGREKLAVWAATQIG